MEINLRFEYNMIYQISKHPKWIFLINARTNKNLNEIKSIRLLKLDEDKNMAQCNGLSIINR